jgi:hypothetical protein
MAIEGDPQSPEVLEALATEMIEVAENNPGIGGTILTAADLAGDNNNTQTNE